MNLRNNGKLFTSKSVGTGPSSYEKRIYGAMVWYRALASIIPGRERFPWN